MNIEKYVCTLEQSKKLKELGIKQESFWYWVRYWKSGRYEWDLFQKDESDKVNTHISAFTCGELGEMLPRFINVCNREYCLVISKEIRNDKLEWSVRYECQSNDGYRQQVGYTMAEALANMLIMLQKEETT